MKLNEKINVLARNMEFYIPVNLIRPLTKLIQLRVPNPYNEENDEFKCIFIHVPKVAGTSMTKALFGANALHIPLSRYALFDKNKFDRYFKFCFVRNPWARVFSAYNYMNERVGDDTFPDSRWASYYLSEVSSFEDFILMMKNKTYRSSVKKYIHFRDQYLWVSLQGNLFGKRSLAMDFIGKFEQLDSDFKLVSERLGVSANLPKLRPGGGDDYRQYYTEHMIDIVSDIYREDLKHFDYQFDDV